MKTRGKFINATRDLVSRDINITFQIPSECASYIDEIKDIELDIEAKKHRNRRSLDSNAYAWVLMQKIAEATHSDRWTVYLQMLQRYSREFTFVICKEKALDRLKELYRTCIDFGVVNVNGTEGHQLQVFFGSSEFDSKAMSVFLEGIISECKELGIETMSPGEIQRMNACWGKNEKNSRE